MVLQSYIYRRTSPGGDYMRKPNPILLLLLFVLISIPAIADRVEAANLETDPDLFATILSVTNWSVPSGYQMEGYLRTDLNGDEITDAVVLLQDNSDHTRSIAILMSSANGYQVYQNEQAIPFQAVDASVFAGINAWNDHIVLYTQGLNEDCFENEYVFSRDGSQFSLTEIKSTQWNQNSMEATQQTFDFKSGESRTKSGMMRTDGFITTSDETVSTDAYPPITAPYGLHNTTINWEDLSPKPEQQSDLDASSATEGIYCNACQQLFLTGEAFRNHQCISEPIYESEMIICSICEQQFESEEELTNHLCVSQEDETIQCDVCHQRFDSESFQTHICISYLDDNSVYCDLCNQWYPEGEAFRDHVCVALETTDNAKERADKARSDR